MNERRFRRKRGGLPAAQPDFPDVVSFTECTGLMQTPPRTPEEWEAYHKLFTSDLTDEPYWHKSE